MQKKQNIQPAIRILALALILQSFRQSSETKYLFWKPEVKLKWTDFQGHVKPEDDDAASASYIGFFHKIKKCQHPDSIFVDSRAFFNKSSSWVKIPVLTPSLLSHEQLHFDLAELYARKFRKSMQRAKIKMGTLILCVDSNYKYYSAKADSIHFRYDVETNHGLNNTNQFQWEEKVKNEMSEMALYSGTLLKLYLEK